MRQALLPDLEHAEREITRNHRRTGAMEWISGGASTTGEIEDSLPRRRLHRGHDCAPPETRLAQGEDVVGPVVARRDVIEHRRHLMRFLMQVSSGHALEPRMDRTAEIRWAYVCVADSPLAEGERTSVRSRPMSAKVSWWVLSQGQIGRIAQPERQHVVIPAG